MITITCGADAQALREKLGMTQEQLAEAARLHVTWVQKAERCDTEQWGMPGRYHRTIEGALRTELKRQAQKMLKEIERVGGFGHTMGAPGEFSAKFAPDEYARWNGTEEKSAEEKRAEADIIDALHQLAGEEVEAPSAVEIRVMWICDGCGNEHAASPHDDLLEQRGCNFCSGSPKPRIVRRDAACAEPEAPAPPPWGDLVGAAAQEAARRFGGEDGVFSAAGFSTEMREHCAQTLDGKMVRAILSGRSDVIPHGPAHYRYTPTKKVAEEPGVALLRMWADALEDGDKHIVPDRVLLELVETTQQARVAEAQCVYEAAVQKLEDAARAKDAARGQLDAAYAALVDAKKATE